MNAEQERAAREALQDWKWPFLTAVELYTHAMVLLTALDDARVEVETVNRLAERAIDDARAERDAYRRNASLAERRRTEQAEAERDAARRDLAVAQEHLMWTGGLPDIEALVSRMKNAEAERDTLREQMKNSHATIEKALAAELAEVSPELYRDGNASWATHITEAIRVLRDRQAAFLSHVASLEHWYRTLAASADHIGAGILTTVADDLAALRKDSEG